MNERIAELAKQAYGVDDAKPLHPSALVALDAFAKLIVAECIECLKPLSRNHSMVGAAQDTIKQHFGVEK